ncbi:hypothetical protein F5I97DRAFT_1806994 [Phlebopus sp. FC_14]|nr:hypothetical protein F5I97DRAFT_1806994 [Phlebopus sp. FC_14]
MSDITVLVLPTTPPRHSFGFNFARRSQNDLTQTAHRPVMITLERVDSGDVPPSPVDARTLNEALLSPPKNTFKAARFPLQVPKRSASEPPHTSLTRTSDASNPQKRTFTDRYSPSVASTHRGELLRPPPPLFRPTTFWRRTKRSGVTGPSYSPSSYLVRRSTFIAAGLSLDKPGGDLSALCVESRVPFLVLGPDYYVL